MTTFTNFNFAVRPEPQKPQKFVDLKNFLSYSIQLCMNKCTNVFIVNFWLFLVATILVITLLTIAACKKLKTSKAVRDKKSAYHSNNCEGSNTSIDMSKSGGMQKGWQEKTESIDKDPIYSSIDDVHLGVSKIPSSASHSSVEPYCVPMTKADFDKESHYYELESVRDPVHTSNTAGQCKKKPLHHFETYTSGVDAEDYMEMKEIVL